MMNNKKEQSELKPFFGKEKQGRTAPVRWVLTEQDKAFLRSCNIRPE